MDCVCVAYVCDRPTGVGVCVWSRPGPETEGSHHHEYQGTTRRIASKAHGGCLGVWGRRRTWPRDETPWGAAGKRRSKGIRMGQPGGGDTPSRHAESIGMSREPGELKHLSTLRKREYSRSSGERNGSSLNQQRVRACRRCVAGVERANGFLGRGIIESETRVLTERCWKGRPERVRVP
jgi:hypothetical protein